MSIRKPYNLIAFVFGLFFVLPVFLSAQVVVTGPACVTTGVSYQYDITGPWQSNSSFQVCVTGGVLVNTNTTCFSGNPVSFIRVNWNELTSTGHLAVTTASGNATLDISITKSLDGGSIDSGVQFQKVDPNNNPSTITCSMPSGGSCSPSYSYQWQQSYDMMDWMDISGETNQNLVFTAPATQIIYYRRKVTETGSHAMAFSTIATVANN